MTFETWFSEQHASIPLRSAASVLALVADGGTVPFIARYRKEQTGNLDEVKIQAVIDAKEKWDAITKRQAFILEEIEKQKKLTPELKEKISGTFELERLEDLYLPYKVKRKTKAQAAREAGLERLAEWIWNVGHGTEQPHEGQTLELWAFTFRNEEKGVNDAEAAIQGAQDILIERLSETQPLRELVRTRTFETGVVKTGKGPKVKANSKYSNYFEYHEPVSSLLKPQNSHRYLAVRRGWMEEELTLGVGGKPGPEAEAFEAELLRAFEAEACPNAEAPVAPVLKRAARLALKAHVLPAIENEAHKKLREVADEAAIQVFAENVSKLLLASPLGPKAVLGVDPGIRTGCKLAVVDDSGKYVASTVIHLQSEKEKENAKTLLKEVVTNGSIRAIAVGNGTGGRETESFLRAVLKENAITDIPVVMVSEAGASVYSASEAAREEFPDLDLTVRGAISIARRLQDPLAELVKIDPKSIGVGQYQHDVSQPALKRSLEQVVDRCVNQVGVNLNTASYHLLSHVAGIGPGLAKAIVEHRGTKGLFRSRSQLLDVARFSQKVFEQSAGFLRVPESENPLDHTSVHPERYPVIEAQARKLGRDVRELMGTGVSHLKSDREFRELLGEFTFKDVIDELEKPGRDPRSEFVPFQYRDDIHQVKDLQPGMICPGIVTNVTNFGAFVDIGVHQDGLVHLSQLSDRYVKEAAEIVAPGDQVKVRVLAVDLEKNQISLSMRLTEAAERGAPRGEAKERKKPRGERGGRGPKRDERPRPSVSPEARAMVGQGGAAKVITASAPSAPPRGSDGRGPSGGGAGKSYSSGGARPGGKPAPAFNNAFAGLASLRNQLKKP